MIIGLKSIRSPTYQNDGLNSKNKMLDEEEPAKEDIRYDEED